MTAQQHRIIRDIHAKLETRDTAAQATREAQAGETAWSMWEVLFYGGEYRRAAQQWRECIHASFTQEDNDDDHHPHH